MRNFASWIAAASLPLLASCASIIEGSTDHINVVTSPPVSATCTLTNARSSWTSYVPSSVSVKKSISDMNILCQDPRSGATGTKTIASKIEPWDFGNILFGGLIGMGVDWITGAAYNYPDDVTVPMMIGASPVPMAPAAVPIPMAPAGAPYTPIMPPSAQPMTYYPQAAPVVVPRPQYNYPARAGQ